MDWTILVDKKPSEKGFYLVKVNDMEPRIMSFHTNYEIGERRFHLFLFGRWIYQTHKVTHWIKIPE